VKEMADLGADHDDSIENLMVKGAISASATGGRLHLMQNLPLPPPSQAFPGSTEAWIAPSPASIANATTYASRRTLSSPSSIPSSLYDNATSDIDGPDRATQNVGRQQQAQTGAVDESIEVEVLAKVLVVGNAKCGKSSVISRYTSGVFNNNYKTTIGADFVRKDVLVDMAPISRGVTDTSATENTTSLRTDTHEDTSLVGVRVQLWDIAGQDRFQKLTRAYFANARGVIIVCDVSREGTIDAVRKWKLEVDRCAASSGQYWDGEPNSDLPRLPVILLANKSDLLQNAAQAFKLGATMERLCVELGFLNWWICSARTGEALQDAFRGLLQEVVRQDVVRQLSASDRLDKTAAKTGAFRLRSRSEDARIREEEDDEMNFTDCC
jgi:small GTP-binding protein